MVDTFFNQPVKNIIGTYDIIRSIATGQGDDYTTGCLLHYPNFRENYMLIPIDIIKQHYLEAYPKTIQQINFTANLN